MYIKRQCAFECFCTKKKKNWYDHAEPAIFEYNLISAWHRAMNTAMQTVDLNMWKEVCVYIGMAKQIHCGE